MRPLEQSGTTRLPNPSLVCKEMHELQSKKLVELLARRPKKENWFDKKLATKRLFGRRHEYFEGVNLRLIHRVLQSVVTSNCPFLVFRPIRKRKLISRFLVLQQLRSRLFPKLILRIPQQRTPATHWLLGPVTRSLATQRTRVQKIRLVPKGR